jgi:sec-independent protein translocase protein TatA
MFGIGWTELVVVFVLALLVFGPKRLPEIGRALAQGLRMFKEASREVRESFTDVQAEFDHEIRKAENARREFLDPCWKTTPAKNPRTARLPPCPPRKIRTWPRVHRNSF